MLVELFIHVEVNIADVGPGKPGAFAQKVDKLLELLGQGLDVVLF